MNFKQLNLEVTMIEQFQQHSLNKITMENCKVLVKRNVEVFTGINCFTILSDGWL